MYELSILEIIDVMLYGLVFHCEYLKNNEPFKPSTIRLTIRLNNLSEQEKLVEFNSLIG